MLYAIIGILVIIADQWVKWWVSAGGTGESGFALIPGVLSMVNVHNKGAAFGFLASGNPRIYFIILTGVFTLLVILALATKFISGPVSRWSIVLVTAGGLSNCIDRVINGYVQDMFKIEIPFLDWFPVFNVADVFITVFCLLFVLAVIFGRPRKEEDDLDLDDEFEDSYEEEPAPERTSAKERRAARKAARAAAYEEDAALIEEPPVRSRRSAPRHEEPVEAPAPRTQRRAAQPAPAADPFAEWDRVNAQAEPAPRRQTRTEAAAPRQVRTEAPARPAQRPAAPAAQPKPAAPKKAEPARKPASESFDLDDILAEFK